MTHYHSREYDLISKELFKNLELPLLQYITGKPVQLLNSLNIQFEQIESREADLLYEAVINQQAVIIHLEVQSANDKTMLTRMLRYLTEIHAIYQRPVYQCVIYLGKAPVAMPQQLSFELDPDSKLDYRYHILALNEIPFATLTQMEPVELLALLPLTASEWEPERHLQQAIDLVTERSQALDFNSRSRLLLKTEVLAGLRFERQLIEKICKEAMTMFKIEESSTFQMILEKGMEKGMEKGHQKGRQEGLQEGLKQAQERFRQRVQEILRKRFGPLPVSLTERLQPLNLDELDQALANALDAESLQQFIDTL